MVKSHYICAAIMSFLFPGKVFLSLLRAHLCVPPGRSSLSCPISSNLARCLPERLFIHNFCPSLVSNFHIKFQEALHSTRLVDFSLTSAPSILFLCTWAGNIRSANAVLHLTSEDLLEETIVQILKHFMHD